MGGDWGRRRKSVRVAGAGTAPVARVERRRRRARSAGSSGSRFRDVTPVRGVLRTVSAMCVPVRPRRGVRAALRTFLRHIFDRYSGCARRT